jgi:hypothetical protein
MFSLTHLANFSLQYDPQAVSRARHEVTRKWVDMSALAARQVALCKARRRFFVPAENAVWARLNCSPQKLGPFKCATSGTRAEEIALSIER